MTNDDLAKSCGVSKRTLQNTRSIANLNPEVQDIIESGQHEYNKMDLVALSKESDEVQLEVVNLIAIGKCRTTLLIYRKLCFQSISWFESICLLKPVVRIGIFFGIRP